MSFHSLAKAPFWIATPASQPVAAATAAKGRAAGLSRPHTTELRVPVARPAIGPASAATSTVPTESR